MTEDEGTGDLLHGDADEDDAGRRRGTGVWVGLGVLVVVAVLLVLGLRAVSPHRATAASRPTAASSSSQVPAPSTAAPSTGPGEGPVVLEVPLSGARDRLGRTTLTVGLGAPVLGHAPPQVPNFSLCGADPEGLEYLPVEIREPLDGLDAAVSVVAGPATPAHAGRLGFFFRTGADMRPCNAGKPWPTTDNFEATNDPEAVTGYLVLEDAVTTASPQGRADVLSSLQIRVASPVRLTDDGVRHPLTAGTPTVGSRCPDDRTELCAPLG